MRNKKSERNLEIIEDAKLQLSFLKENIKFRKCFGKLKKNIEPLTFKGADFNDERSIIIFSETCEEILLEMGFSIHSIPSLYGMACEGILLDILNPEKDINEVHSDRLEFLLLFMFYFPGLQEIPSPALSLFHHPESSFNLEDLKSYERLLRVDMRKSKKSLMKEFEEFIDNKLFLRKIDNVPLVEREEYQFMPKELKEACESLRIERLESYKDWCTDNTRKRREAWNQLKIWKMRREKKSFSEISKELNISEDTAKHAFYRAYERIEQKEYIPLTWNKWMVQGREYGGICTDCPKRESCTDLCPDVIPFVDQDTRKTSRESGFTTQEKQTLDECQDYLLEKNRFRIKTAGKLPKWLVSLPF